MLDINDYLKLTPWDALIEMVNQKYLVNLDSKATELLDFTPGVGTETSITLKIQRSNAQGNLLPNFDQRTFTYSRLDLASYFASNPVNLTGFKVPVSTYSIIKRITQLTGIQFDHNDFINEVIHDETVLANFELTAHPRSLRWVGEAALPIVATKSDLSDVIVNPNSDALKLPSGQSTKIQGQHLLMPFDFTLYRNDMLALNVVDAVIPPARLVSIINKVTRNINNWVCDGTPSAYNIAESIQDDLAVYKVLYNGPVISKWSPRTEMRNVVVLQLSDTLCTNIAGNLLLHYR